MDGGNAINKILFLKVRAMKKDAATLVASGPQGSVYVVVNFLYQVYLYFSFVLISLAVITIPENKRKTKIT